MKEKKKFWETGVGQVLKSAAPSAIDLIGDVVPGGALLKNIFDNTVMKNPAISAVDKESLKMDFNASLKEYELRERDLLLKDIADARDMQKVALQQDDLFSKRFIYYLTAASVILSFGYIFAITFIKLPEGAQRFADTIQGVIISMVIGSIYGFHYGSSEGSKKKDKNTQ